MRSEGPARKAASPRTKPDMTMKTSTPWAPTASTCGSLAGSPDRPQ